MIDQLLFLLPVLIFSVVVHECAHGIVAERAGDPTARMLGRITLNPIKHIDLVGSILVPGFLILTGSTFFIAWAKPVPVNPAYFKNKRQDEIKVSFAGPLSNLILSVIFLILSLLWIDGFGVTDLSNKFLYVFRMGMYINLLLAFFNLLPIPPLDGSHILENMLPPEFAQIMAKIRPYGFYILIGLMMTGFFRVIFIPVRIIYGMYQDIIQYFL